MAFFNQYPYTDFHELNIDWVLEQLKDLKSVVEQLEERTKEVEELYEQIDALYQHLVELYDDIVAGNIPQPILDTILNWCKNNLYKLVAQVMKNVYFGLDNDGHFVAYIPQSWSDLKFNTSGYDINVDIQPQFGHLILSY